MGENSTQLTTAQHLDHKQCVIKGNVSSLECLIQKNPELLKSRDEGGAGALHHATASANLEVIRLIVATVGLEGVAMVFYRRPELNTQDDQGRTPLHWAVEKNQEDSCSMLLEMGADPNILSTALMSPLHLAISRERNNLVQLLVSCGRVDVDLEGDLGNTPVMMACSHNNCQALHILFKCGAKLCHQNKLGHFAIHAVAFAGAKEAMEVILQKGEELGISTTVHINYLDKSKCSPLHLAVRGGNTEVIRLCICKGAKVDQRQCDKSTALHFACTQGAIEAVKIMLLPYKQMEEIINIRDGANQTPLHSVELFPCQSKAVTELLSDEDFDGCTPLHYACKLGIHDSVKNMLGLKISLGRKSKQKKSALHFAAEYGRLNTCIRLLETINDSRLLNEGDENGLTPLHLASKGGHTKVVDLLLRRGALFQGDYKGWSCLHHAAAEGYTQTMVILLAANVKLLDNTDEDGNTALHIAARKGHVAAVKLLLNRGAQIVLNKNDASFLHEAVRNGKKDVVNAAIENERSEEALSLFKKGSNLRCVVMDLIEFLPESTKITYNFKWLQAPVQLKKFAKTDKTMYFQPLASLNAMVDYNRLELLTHPVCQKYLEMKWKAYGSKVHLLNLAVYLLGLLPLTYLIISLKPHHSVSANSTSITIEPISFRTQNYMVSVSMIMVLVMNVYAICKELVQMAQQRLSYFMDSSNPSDWVTALSSLAFVIPMFFSTENKWQWEAGALAILFAWINFLLYFQRFERFGIYVVMFGEIIKTLISTIVLFVFLLLAFSLSFHALMLHRVEFNSISLSLAQTFVMTVGELNYQNSLLEAYEQNMLAFPEITYFVFVLFVLLMPILLMNLMIGLAVGDIAEVQRNATLKRIAMQGMIEQFWNFGGESEVRIRLNTSSSQSSTLEREIMKQKNKLKEISSVLEKQHSLLKLIIQKMEITSEADEHDGPQDFRAIASAVPLCSTRRSRWVPLIQALGVKK
ncbi:hypothetical protein NFI96_000308 [Prochilodus magdalenae]|nr:hypothetical protein NFI96_000308 [Prochilodus magdalenae]